MTQKLAEKFIRRIRKGDMKNKYVTLKLTDNESVRRTQRRHKEQLHNTEAYWQICVENPEHRHQEQEHDTLSVVTQ